MDFPVFCPFCNANHKPNNVSCSSLRPCAFAFNSCSNKGDLRPLRTRARARVRRGWAYFLTVILMILTSSNGLLLPGEEGTDSIF